MAFLTNIDGRLLKEMIIDGAAMLEHNKAAVDALNVFPVPDGDTGTNMSLTMMSAVKELSAVDSAEVSVVAAAAARGALKGARGNSGVILSQILRGFARGIDGAETIDAETFAKGLEAGAKTAYKAVMKPKEGTILTVIRVIAEDSARYVVKHPGDLPKLLDKVIRSGEAILEKTPDMLPALKQAGVVDSGGQGLLTVLKGWRAAFNGEKIEDTTANIGSAATFEFEDDHESMEEVKFKYCTEFIIMLDKPMSPENEHEFKEFLMSIGDSIVLVADEDIVKVHVHTNDPGKAISRALTYGSLTRIKIDNMREEHQEKLIKDAAKVAEQQKFEEEERKKMVPPKPVGFISVSIGEGIGEIFRELGVDYLIEGGQTMNPSTEDMLRAIEEVNAETIYILPNNKNIILAANQAKLLTKDKEVIVIPTKTVPQGITAVVTYSAEASVEENTEAMSEEIKNVKTGQITYAVRDTHIDDKEIHEGDFMEIGDHEILAVGKEIQDVTLETIALMDADDAELITVYYGEDTKAEDAEKLEQALTEKYPSCDVEVDAGGQPIYYYVVSVE